jgi:hypothetical protein
MLYNIDHKQEKASFYPSLAKSIELEVQQIADTLT